MTREREKLRGDWDSGSASRRGLIDRRYRVGFLAAILLLGAGMALASLLR